ncbi:hypothetical protein F5Y14DRAFT_463570 [Nemania sp. NC0429]|nr:hypothetical protein F5Y14DRAFT_463570 [Nemania sp. NC0429]
MSRSRRTSLIPPSPGPPPNYPPPPPPTGGSRRHSVRYPRRRGLAVVIRDFSLPASRYPNSLVNPCDDDDDNNTTAVATAAANAAADVRGHSNATPNADADVDIENGGWLTMQTRVQERVVARYHAVSAAIERSKKGDALSRAKAEVLRMANELFGPGENSGPSRARVRVSAPPGAALFTATSTSIIATTSTVIATSTASAAPTTSAAVTGAVTTAVTASAAPAPGPPPVARHTTPGSGVVASGTRTVAGRSASAPAPAPVEQPRRLSLLKRCRRVLAKGRSFWKKK